MATQLLGFFFASCYCLISHFKNHPARGDVFSCKWISLYAHSLQHVSLPQRRQKCVWHTHGFSFMNIWSIEVVIWWEKHGGESGRPFWLTVWSTHCWWRNWEVNESWNALSAIVFLLFPVYLCKSASFGSCCMTLHSESSLLPLNIY